MLQLKRRGKTWYVTGFYEGKRIRVSAKTDDQMEAQRVRLRIENELINGNSADASTKEGEVFGFAMASYLKRREFTSESTLRYLNMFNEMWGEVPLLKMDQHFIAEYIDVRYTEVQSATIRREVNALMPVLRHAKKRGLITMVPDVDRPADGEPRTRCLDHEELEAFSRHAGDPNGSGITARYCMTCFLLATGARIGEAVALSWDDVELDVDQPFVTLYTRKTKGQKKVARRVPLHGDMQDLMIQWRSTQARSKKVWSAWQDSRGAGKAVKSLMSLIGIKDFQPHDLRRTFATELLKNGVRERVVADLLGHSSLAMVMRYMIPPDSTKVDAIASLYQRSA